MHKADLVVSSVGMGSVALVLKDLSFAVFGLPVSAIALALGGALAGLIHLPPNDEGEKVRRHPGWLVTLANALTGCALTLLLQYIAKIEDPKLLGPLCFLIAYAPVPVVSFIRERLGVTRGPQ